MSITSVDNSTLKMPTFSEKAANFVRTKKSHKIEFNSLKSDVNTSVKQLNSINDKLAKLEKQNGNVDNELLNSLKAEKTKMIAVVEDLAKQLGNLSDRTSQLSKSFNTPANGVKPEKVFKPAVKLFKFVGEHTNKLKGAKGLATAVVIGNLLKEMVGTTMYTMQALTNQDLPKDKRKFVGMYDLMVGIVSTTCSAIFGFAAIGGQDKLIDMMLKNSKGAKYPRQVAAAAGLAFFIPTFLQTIIGKRIVAPAIATPWAGKMKDKKIAEAEQKKQANKQDAINIPLENDSMIASTDTKAISNMPTIKGGFVDLKTYTEQIKALQEPQVENAKKSANVNTQA